MLRYIKNIEILVKAGKLGPRSQTWKTVQKCLAKLKIAKITQDLLIKDKIAHRMKSIYKKVPALEKDIKAVIKIWKKQAAKLMG